MRALLNNDVIVSLVMNETDGTEIGDLPKGVGVERLRFNGSGVVDLASLTAFWIEEGNFALHCVRVSNSQYFEMSYVDRKRLVWEDSGFRLKTLEEIIIEEQAAKIQKLKNILKIKLRNSIGDIQDQNMNTLAFVCALIVYARLQPAALGTFFDEIIPDIVEIFPLSTWEQTLKSGAKDLKTAMQEYYAGLENL